MAHPRLNDALVLVAPHHKVQEVGQVTLSHAVLGGLGVRYSILVQREDAEPAVRVDFRPPPAYVTAR